MMPDAGTAAPVRLLVIEVGGRRFGLPLEEVHGVQAPALGEGVALYRGAAVPVVDGRSLLGSGGTAAGGPGGLVIIGPAGGEIGLAVDRVEGFFDVVEIRDLPELVSPFVRGTFRGVATGPEGELLVVDAAALGAGAAEHIAGRGGGEA